MELRRPPPHLQRVHNGTITVDKVEMLIADLLMGHCLHVSSVTKAAIVSLHHTFKRLMTPERSSGDFNSDRSMMRTLFTVGLSIIER